jgi:putative Ca2+/H+ antiporter (TMEM165/GDT1 family)
MKHPRATVFAGAIISLSLMHIMASFFGYATTVIPRGIPTDDRTKASLLA